MTGFGTGTHWSDGINAMVEIRSLNNRFVELNSRLPKSIQNREAEIKDILRRELQRGKIQLTVVIERESSPETALTVDEQALSSVLSTLEKVREKAGIQEPIRMDHLLRFSEIFKAPETGDSGEPEWRAVQPALLQAISRLKEMRKREGETLTGDLRSRIESIGSISEQVRVLTDERLPVERQKLHDRVAQLIGEEKINPDRLELEIVLLADRMDITEEQVRLKSHLAYFLTALDGHESVGRKLNFLVQEINREINTIGSKSASADISQLVVLMKEELERIREQLQNLE